MRGASLKRTIIVVLGLFMVLTFSGCAEIKTGFKKLRDTFVSKPEKEEPSQKMPVFVHKVRWSGEPLSIIAKWYTGKFDHWRSLAKANPKLNPKRIYIGKRIVIPEDLLKTRKPMPKSFLDQFSPEKKTAETPKKAPTEENKEPQLFGPKEYKEQ